MQSEKQATAPEELERQVMCPSVAKNEREWWAAHEIDSLRAEIVRLRDVIDDQTDRAEWNYECVMKRDEKVIQRDAEIARLRLTDAEREAIEAAIDRFRDWVNGTDDEEREVTLRGLLERLG